MSKVENYHGPRHIFEVEVTQYQFAEMRRRAEAEMVAEEDGVKFFPLCGRCCDTVITYGRYVKTEESGSYLVV